MSTAYLEWSELLNPKVGGSRVINRSALLSPTTVDGDDWEACKKFTGGGNILSEASHAFTVTGVVAGDAAVATITAANGNSETITGVLCGTDSVTVLLSGSPAVGVGVTVAIIAYHTNGTVQRAAGDNIVPVPKECDVPLRMMSWLLERILQEQRNSNLTTKPSIASVYPYADSSNNVFVRYTITLPVATSNGSFPECVTDVAFQTS